MDANERMPGDREAAGAVAGMVETYGGPMHCYAIGDEVWFQPTVGAMPRPGRVVALFSDGRLEMADRDGSTHVITSALIAEF